MTFANPLYSAVTRQFFDLLASTMNQSFQDRCRDLHYKDGKRKSITSGDPKKEQCVDTMIENYEEDKGHNIKNSSDDLGKVFNPTLEKQDKLRIIQAEQEKKTKLSELNSEKLLIVSVRDTLNDSELTVRFTKLIQNDRNL